VRLLDRCGHREERPGVHVVGAELDRHEERLLVGARDRLAHACDRVQLRHPGRDPACRGPGILGVEPVAAGRDQHELGRRRVESGVVEHGRAPPRLAHPVVGLGHALGGHGGGERHRESDEDQPAADRPPRVDGAPACCPER